jgi:hypothetical protein
MGGIRFSTRAMLIGFACVGVVLALLARPAAVTVSIATALWFLTILIAPLGIIFRTGATRAFWIGVAVFGWGQILSERMLGSAWRPLINQPVQFLHRLYFGSQPSGVQTLMFPPAPGVPASSPFAPSSPITVPQQVDPSAIPSDTLFGPTAVGAAADFQLRHGYFTEIGISLGMILVALVGGAAAIYFYRTQVPSDAKGK